MLTATTVITPERFRQGLTWADFLGSAKVNRDKFEHNYDNPVLTREDLAVVGPDSKWSTEPGAYTVLVGGLHQDLTVR